MNWYYVEGGRQAGPIGQSELEQLVRAGTITTESLVWREGMTDWQPYGRIGPGAAPVLAPPVAGTESGNAMLCSECGRAFATDELIRYETSQVCAGCKPAFFQRLREGGRIPTALEYAGFWIRAGAKVLDIIVRSIFGFGVGLVIGVLMPGLDARQVLARTLVSSLAGLIIGLIYTVWFLGKFGATPGKMACGLKVVTAAGEPISYGRACGRYFAELLSGILLSIGYLMAAFDDEKRTLHDRICDTRVVKNDPV
jgi:uncharacterized RDD family membrane protein YckC